MLPDFCNSYFSEHDNVHKPYTRQKHRNEYYQLYTSSESGKKTLHHISSNVWKNIPKIIVIIHFQHSKYTTERMPFQIHSI